MADDQERKDLYKAHIENVEARELSNTEAYDKAILSLSSAGLALSATLIKFVVPIKEAIFLTFLYLAWISFGISIICTIVSFLTSQKALSEDKNRAERYYLEGDESAIDEENKYGQLTGLYNLISGITFILAIIFIIFFTILNISNTANSEEIVMSENQRTTAQDGQTVPKMQRPFAGNGQTVPKMQQVPKKTDTPKDGK